LVAEMLAITLHFHFSQERKATHASVGFMRYASRDTKENNIA
jgi:hypothetical protein